MVFIVKKEIVKDPNFAVYTLTIFSKECIFNFKEGHINRVWSISQRIGDVTCIININKKDEEDVPIGIPNDNLIDRCIRHSILLTIDNITKKLIAGEYFFPVDHKIFLSLIGRNFLRNDKLKILEPIDNRTYEFEFNITLTGIKMQRSITGVLTEIKKIISLDNSEEKEVSNAIVGIFSLIDAYNKKLKILKMEIELIHKNDLKSWEDEQTVINNGIQEINESIKWNKSQEEKIRLNKEKAEKEKYKQDIENIITREKIKLSAICTEINRIEDYLERLGENKIFVATHMYPIEEK